MIAVQFMGQDANTTVVRYIANCIQLARMGRLLTFTTNYQELLLRCLTSRNRVSKWMSSSWIYMALVGYAVIWVINLVGCLWCAAPATPSSSSTHLLLPGLLCLCASIVVGHGQVGRP